jgi:phosphotransferase system enzyme I (PtsI)
VLRTEFLFLDEPPDERHQYETYRQMARALDGLPLIIRTLDAGGDKPLPYLDMPVEANPFLGLRGLRLSLARPVVFRTQLRAILRASAHGNVRLMYPMVSDVSELVAANAVLAECREELLAEGVEVSTGIQAGAMIEVPAAAVCADLLAREAAFLSVGTNDLTQYALAADRNNALVAGVYNQKHPAIIRLLKMTVDGARRHGRPVAVCGEIAAELDALPLLVGLGIGELSVGPHSLEAVRAALARIDSREATRLVESEYLK